MGWVGRVWKCTLQFGEWGWFNIHLRHAMLRGCLFLACYLLNQDYRNYCSAALELSREEGKGREKEQVSERERDTLLKVLHGWWLLTTSQGSLRQWGRST